MNKLKLALLWLGGLGLFTPMSSPAADESKTKAPTMTAMRIKIGDKVFTARLEENATAAAFAAMLPLTLEMKDLNENEKVISLRDPLPGQTSNPGTIRTGDLMIWSARSLVLFYKTFPTAYHYARLGRIEDPAGLIEAVGTGSVTVTFEKTLVR